jgi:hypothetical protein
VDEVTQASRTGWADKDRAEERRVATIRSSPAAALLRVTRVDDECSSSGGTHLTLEVVSQAKGSPHKLVAAGGHAIWITAAPGDLYVAGIGPPEGTSRREAPERCLKDLPAVDGYATAILKVASEDEGRSRLGEILR